MELITLIGLGLLAYSAGYGLAWAQARRRRRDDRRAVARLIAREDTRAALASYLPTPYGRE